jgi:hypothetical protein
MAIFGAGATHQDLSCSASDRETYLIVRADYFLPNRQLSVLQMPAVQNITVVDLNILNVELGLPIDDYTSSVVLLSTGLGIEARSV